jgi:putative hydrolase of the HAD superfamily
VVDYPILLLAGVADTLPQLHGRCRMLLLTKGAQQTQERKLARSGLGHFFEAVHVVPEKSDKVIRELVAYYRLSPEQTWVVGNSPRSDINPALEAGVRAVYIPHSSTWELEQEEIPHSERVIQLRSFRELAALFLEGG